jgi:hypothetical protein
MTRSGETFVESSWCHDLADLRQSFFLLTPPRDVLLPIPHLLIELIQDISKIRMLLSMQDLSIGGIVPLSWGNIDGTVAVVCLPEVILRPELKDLETAFDLDIQVDICQKFARLHNIRIQA